MVTSIGTNQRRRHLYLLEWRDYLGLSDETIGNRLDKDRATIWRWMNEQHRLNPDKIASLAAAMNLEPEQLWHHPPAKDDPPPLPSIDAEVQGIDPDDHKTLLDMARRLARRA